MLQHIQIWPDITPRYIYYRQAGCCQPDRGVCFMTTEQLTLISSADKPMAKI